MIRGHGQGQLGCGEPAPWDCAVQGKDREGWRGRESHHPVVTVLRSPQGCTQECRGWAQRADQAPCSVWHSSNLGGLGRRVGDNSSVTAGAGPVGNVALPCLPSGTGWLVQEVLVSQLQVAQ